jgi:acyl-CoA synthetase (AMP-forming)/AMP-acid ligase II
MNNINPSLFDLNIDNVAIIQPENVTTYRSLYQDLFNLRSLVSEGSSIVIRSNNTLEIMASIISLNGWAKSVHLAPQDIVNYVPNKDVVEIEFKVNNIMNLSSTLITNSNSYSTEWVIYTSGTTGMPKPNTHNLAGLARTVKLNSDTSELIWGMFYSPTRMAGIQVLMQAISTFSTIIVPLFEDSIQKKILFMLKNECSAISATPTIWRQILQVESIIDLNLRQITIGGEIPDQKLLDKLSEQFPEARITQVYATTELGTIFTVSDRKTGFPVSYLNDTRKGVTLEIRDDVLYAKLIDKNGTNSNKDVYVSTQDEVKINGDRVMFLGRKSGVVNVGGTKVWPEQVENIIRQHPEVVDVKVQAKSSEFSGQIIVAQIVVKSPLNKELPREIRTWLKNKLSGPYIPASIKIVESLTLTDNGKIQRK